MHRFWKDRQGNFAVTFALISVVLLGGVGMAIDYSRAVNVESFMQAQADGAALSGVQLGSEGDPSPYLQFVRVSTQDRYGPGEWIDKLDVDGEWISASDFEVTVKGEVPVTILAAVPGFPDAVPVSVRATARLGEPTKTYKAPTVSELDPEAYDYNSISVYCFNPDKADDPKTHGRTQMTLIADNNPATTLPAYVMPECGVDEFLSYKLINVRNALHEPNKPGDTYEYYTDTVIKNKKEKYAFKKSILETVFCDNLKECRPKSQGGVIPEGKERSPKQATRACGPGDAGKYMYYGWEDRPPRGGPSASDDSDSDYDDIRIIIECPTYEVSGKRTVRLIN
jgi:hypothetical protein